MQHYLVVYCTAPNLEIGKKLAKLVVESKLAACVNIIPNIHSVYTWENKLETSEEVLLFIKTQKEAFSGLEKILKESHPYECPEIIAIPIELGSKGYLQWLNQNILEPI